jgi:hypothetical protein
MWLAERVVEVFDQERQSTLMRKSKKRYEKGIFCLNSKRKALPVMWGKQGMF